MRAQNKIYLIKSLDGIDISRIASVEAGYHDGEYHFDHHGKWQDNPAVCTMSVRGNLMDVYITHLDADTIKVIGEMKGHSFGDKLDWNLIGHIDSNGPEVIPNSQTGRYNRAFMLGISDKSRELKFPRSGDEPIDVTDIVYKILETDTDELVCRGLKLMAESAEYTDSAVQEDGNGVVFVVADRGIDAARLYRKGYHTIVIFNTRFNSITIFGSNIINPSPIDDYRQTWAGVKFAGHAHACGSPRGEKFTKEDAERVFEDIVAYIRENSSNWLW